MDEKERLEKQLELLLTLEPETAYTGSLDRLKQGSYIKFGTITKLIVETRRQIKTEREKL